MLSPARPKAAGGPTRKRGDTSHFDQNPLPLNHNRGMSAETKTVLDSRSFHWPDHARQQSSTPNLRSRGASHPNLRDDGDGKRDSFTPSIMTHSMSLKPSKSSLVVRKSSGLKSSLRRMFGSKKYRPSAGSSTQRDFGLSDPGNLITAQANNDTEIEHVGQPVRPVTRSGASSKSTPSQSFRERVADMTDAGLLVPGHKRRNTLPSLVFSDHEAQMFTKSLGDYIGRQNVVQSRSDDTHHMSNTSKRSRSDEALIPPRNKTGLTGDTRQDRLPSVALWRANEVTSTSRSMEEGSATTADSLHIVQDQKSRVPRQTVQPAQSFDFGLGGTSSPADLQERVNTLEVKMFDFEYAIAKLQGANLAKPAVGQALGHSKSTQDLYTKPSMGSMSSTTSGQGLTILTSPTQLSFFVEKKEASDTPSSARTVETIRPSPGPRAPTPRRASPSRDLQQAFEQLETLRALVHDERATRQQMEMQILDMRKEIQRLQTPVYADIRPLDYPAMGGDAYKYDLVAKKVKQLHRSPPIRFDNLGVHEFPKVETYSDAGSESGYEEMYDSPHTTRRAWDQVANVPRYAVPII